MPPAAGTRSSPSYTPANTREPRATPHATRPTHALYAHTRHTRTRTRTRPTRTRTHTRPTRAGTRAHTQGHPRPPTPIARARKRSAGRCQCGCPRVCSFHRRKVTMRRPITGLCSVAGCESPRGSRKRDLCRKHRYRVDRYGTPEDPCRPRPCRVCGEAFKPARASSTVCAEQQCRSEAKRLDDRAFEHRFRERFGAWRSQSPGGRMRLEPTTTVQAGRVPAAVDIFTKSEIGERDNWVCQLCDERVDPGLVFPEPGAPVLAHRVFMADGGRHVRENCVIAHAECRAASGEKY